MYNQIMYLEKSERLIIWNEGRVLDEYY